MPIATQSSSQSMGVSNHYSNFITTSSATAAAVTLTIGFAPRRVRAVCLTSLTSWEWWIGLPATKCLKTAIGDPGESGLVFSTPTYDTGSAIVVDAEDATVTLSADVMEASSDIVVTCEG